MGRGGLDEIELGEGLLKPPTDGELGAEVTNEGFDFNVVDSKKLVVDGLGISRIELVGRSEGISEDEGEPVVLEEGDVKLGGKDLDIVSESVMILGVVVLDL